MLLYHFPLTSSSATANLINKGIKQDYVLRNNVVFETGGKLSSYALRTKANVDGLQIEIPAFTTEYTLCLRINISSNQYLCEINNEQIASSYVGITNSWCDVVIMNNKLYVDKVYKRDLTYSNGKLLIGGLFSNGGTCNCLIQDIRIYDYALSQAEINEYSRALVVHYPLQGNELNTSVLKDVSGFGNDLEGLPNSYQYGLIANRNARGSKMLHLSTKAFSATYTTELKGNPKARTISFWWKASQQTTGVAALRGLQLFILKSNDTSSWLLYNGLTVSANLINLMDLGGIYNVGSIVWHHFAYVIDQTADTIKFYYNAELKGTVQISSLAASRQNTLRGECVLNKVFTPFNWGTTPDNPASDFSDIRVYATSLSAEDIKNLYNSPISISNQHQTMAFELKENPLYPSKYWRTPTYAEMNYILNTRTNAANLRTLGRIDFGDGTYRNGLFLLPDDFVAPSGITLTIPPTDITTNTFTLQQLKLLENIGVVFFPLAGYRTPPYSPYYQYDNSRTYINLGGWQNSRMYALYSNVSVTQIENVSTLNYGRTVRLIHDGTKFSTSATTKIDFATANLQYHCTQHIWRFAEHSYDVIGAANANISDSYNGWIDLFGYGTSGVNYSPTLHTTTNSDYASGDIANTDNDWGINEIQSYDYNVKNFAANENGIVQHNEFRENNSEVNGCYKDKLITNELIEN